MFELDSNFDRPGKGVGWQSGSETDDDYEDDDDGDDGSEADLASGSGSSDDSEESEPVYYNNRVNSSPRPIVAQDLAHPLHDHCARGIDLYLKHVAAMIMFEPAHDAAIERCHREGWDRQGSGVVNST